MNKLITNKLETFFSKYKKRTYRKGEIVIRADLNPSGIIYLTDGFIKKYAISKKGEEIVVNIFKPVAFFPMSWAINDTPNTYYYEAMNDATVAIAPRDEVINFIKNEPDVLYDLMSRVYRGIDGMETRMANLMAGNARSRLITEIIIQAKRFGKKAGNSIEIEVSEKDLAAQSGMTRETISREIKNLKDNNLVMFTKNLLVINDFESLEKEVEDGI